jgi:hypothetical protein
MGQQEQGAAPRTKIAEAKIAERDLWQPENN